jgi:hypothetical protein
MDLVRKWVREAGFEVVAGHQQATPGPGLYPGPQPLGDLPWWRSMVPRVEGNKQPLKVESLLFRGKKPWCHSVLSCKISFNPIHWMVGHVSNFWLLVPWCVCLVGVLLGFGLLRSVGILETFRYLEAALTDHWPVVIKQHMVFEQCKGPRSVGTFETGNWKLVWLTTYFTMLCDIYIYIHIYIYMDSRPQKDQVKS